MRTVGSTFVRSNDQTAVVQAVLRAFGGDPTRALPETPRLRRQLVPFRPIAAPNPNAEHLAAFNRIVVNFFSDIMPAVFVSPSINGWVGVFDQSLEGADDPQPDLARALSRELQTVAVSFWLLHDDLFRYFVAENGKLRDQYMYFASSLDREELTFLTGQDLVGNPALVSKLCGRPAVEVSLMQTLSDERLTPPEVFAGVSAALGITLWPFSHQYLADQPSLDLPDLWHEFDVITLGQIHALPVAS